MPDHEEHCKHSFKRYGVRGEEIHSWLDEPSKVFGGFHRQLRHNYETINEAVKFFGEKYGSETVRNIVTDHFIADSEQDGQNNNNETEERYYDLSFEDFEKLCIYSENEKKWKIDASDKTKAWHILMYREYPKVLAAWIKKLETKRQEQLYKEQKYSEF